MKIDISDPDKQIVPEDTKSRQWPQYLTVLTASIVAFSSGLHFAWTSPALPILQSEEGGYNITTTEASYVVIVAPLGYFIGAPIAGLLGDTIGRKNGLLLISIPLITAWMVIAFAKDAFTICIGRFIDGIGDGFLFIFYPMYVGEVTEPKVRGILGCSLSVCMIIGMIAINCYGPYLSVQNTAFISALFPVIFLITFIWMPESPYYLLMKKRDKDAEKSLRFLRRCNVESDLINMTKDVNRQMSERGSWKDLVCIDTNRKALLIMIFLRTSQQMSGITCWTLLTQTIFIQASDDISPVLSTIIYQVMQLVMSFLSSILLERYGRKPLFIGSTFGSGIILLVGGAYFFLKEATTFDTTAISWLPIIVMLTFIIIFSLGGQTVPTLMLSEMFSASIKGKALCVMCVYYAVLLSSTSKLFYFLADVLGIYASFFTFGVSCLISVIFAYFFVPETKGKSLEEIQQNLKSKHKQDDGNYSTNF